MVVWCTTCRTNTGRPDLPRTDFGYAGRHAAGIDDTRDAANRANALSWNFSRDAAASRPSAAAGFDPHGARRAGACEPWLRPPDVSATRARQRRRSGLNSGLVVQRAHGLVDQRVQRDHALRPERRVDALLRHAPAALRLRPLRAPGVGGVHQAAARVRPGSSVDPAGRDQRLQVVQATASTRRCSHARRQARRRAGSAHAA